MLKIGLFSKLSRVSIRMLRYYDEMGLLRPAYIDPDSDYRYYREDQLQTVGWITALRDMGFSLADVRRMSQLGRDAEALAPFFAARRREQRLLGVHFLVEALVPNFGVRPFVARHLVE